MLRRVDREGLAVPASMQNTFTCEMLGKGTKVECHASTGFANGLAGLLKRDDELDRLTAEFYHAVGVDEYAGDLTDWYAAHDADVAVAKAFGNAVQYDRVMVCSLLVIRITLCVFRYILYVLRISLFVITGAGRHVPS